MTHTASLPLDPDDFLARFWQRKPLLIKADSAGFVPPVDRHELAGLAMEDVVESRLIEQTDGAWSLQHGPFGESDYRRDTHWSLLVQAVDHYLPEVAALRQLVDFLPTWRMDDIMVSYAVDGGSVGPHYDNYDVFLLQGEGRKRWQLGQWCDTNSPLLPHDELRILADFNPTDEYVLEPGDILYVPPRMAHCGTAIGEGTTFSIGFRAPRMSDMVERWIEQLLETLDPERFLEDAGRAPAARPGEIDSRDLANALQQLHSALSADVSNRWFGELVTEPRENQPWAEATTTMAELDGGGVATLEVSGAARLAWQEGADAGLSVFLDGEYKAFTASALPCLIQLCQLGSLAGEQLERALADAGSRELLEFLLERGALHGG